MPFLETRGASMVCTTQVAAAIHYYIIGLPPHTRHKPEPLPRLPPPLTPEIMGSSSASSATTNVATLNVLPALLPIWRFSVRPARIW